MNNKRILIAFDSSDAAFKAIRYAGQMLPNTPSIMITLLFVERLPDEDFYNTKDEWCCECAERIKSYKQSLNKARRHLEQEGFPPEAIEEKYIASCKSPFEDATICSTGESIVGDILRIQHEGKYGTVIVGKRGVSKKEAFLFGSVSNRLIQETTDCTVWVVG